MNLKSVYDLPTRVFHWLFATLFLMIFGIAKIVDDESVVFSYHMLFGMTLGCLVLCRILWGVLGTKHARFSDFALRPKELVEYFKSILSGEKKHWAGHNPASSWAAVVMMGLALCLAVSGYLMASGYEKELIEEIHEIFANALFVTAVLHVAGVVLHTIRYKEAIGLSMVHGKKVEVEPGDAIVSQRPIFALALLILVGGLLFYLFQNFDSSSRTIRIMGTVLQLGENEEENEDGQNQYESHDDDHGHDHDHDE